MCDNDSDSGNSVSGIGRHDYGRVAEHPTDFHAGREALEIFDPELVLGYYRRIEAILDACPIDIYAASSLKHPWPYRLQNAAECYPASFWRSQHRILDSAISAPELSNRDVLGHAVERHATAVVAKDYLPFDAYEIDEDTSEERRRAIEALRATFSDNREATTASIREFAAVYDPGRHPPAYIPLHPPYDEHYREVAPIIRDAGLPPRFMLGGLAGASPRRRLDELLAFRAEAGSEPVAHGLGWGLSDELVSGLREEPNLLDSVDNSGPSQAIQNDKVLDKHWQAAECPQVSGKYQNAIGGAYEFGTLLAGAQRLTEFNDDEFAPPTKHKRLTEFGGGVLADD